MHYAPRFLLRFGRTAGALAMVTILVAACAAPGAEDTDSTGEGAGALSAGDPVTFRLPALDGGELASDDLTGRVVLLDFWATWCVPCRAQKAVLEEVVPEYPKDALHVLAVDVGEEATRVREHVADEPSPFPVVLDRDTSFFTSLGLVALPSLLVLDAEGRLVEQVTGVIDARRLRAVLGEATMVATQTSRGRGAAFMTPRHSRRRLRATKSRIPPSGAGLAGRGRS